MTKARLTLAQAVANITQPASSNQWVHGKEPYSAKICQARSRHAELIREMAENPMPVQVTSLAHSLIEAVAQGTIEPDQAFAVAFGNGVLAGCEMMIGQEEHYDA